MRYMLLAVGLGCRDLCVPVCCRFACYDFGRCGVPVALFKPLALHNSNMHLATKFNCTAAFFETRLAPRYMLYSSI